MVLHYSLRILIPHRAAAKHIIVLSEVILVERPTAVSAHLHGVVVVAASSCCSVLKHQ